MYNYIMYTIFSLYAMQYLDPFANTILSRRNTLFFNPKTTIIVSYLYNFINVIANKLNFNH